MENLIKVKTQLVNICNNCNYEDYDYEQLVYLIDLIDWILLKKVNLDKQTITALMEEIIATSVQQLNMDLLDTLKELTIVKEMLIG